MHTHSSGINDQVCVFLICCQTVSQVNGCLVIVLGDKNYYRVAPLGGHLQTWQSTRWVVVCYSWCGTCTSVGRVFKRILWWCLSCTLLRTQRSLIHFFRSTTLRASTATSPSLTENAQSLRPVPPPLTIGIPRLSSGMSNWKKIYYRRVCRFCDWPIAEMLPSYLRRVNSTEWFIYGARPGSAI